MSAKTLALAALLLTGCAEQPTPVSAKPPAEAMRAWAAACADNDDWDKPGPPYLIHGNTWYVGTCGISAILIVGDEGHALIDSGTDAGAQVVAANVRKLGFGLSDVDELLASHEHFDHVGGIARLQRLTGAKLVSSPRAAPVLRSGIVDPEDPQAGMHDPFAGADVGYVLEMRNGEAVILGATAMTAIATPGHTPGALTWHWQSCDGRGPCRTIVYADSLSPVSRDDYRFSDHPAYLAAYRASLDKVAALDCDILITPHPSASGMRTRLLEGDLIDPNACKVYAAALSKRLDARLAQEAAAR